MKWRDSEPGFKLNGGKITDRKAMRIPVNSPPRRRHKRRETQFGFKTNGGNITAEKAVRFPVKLPPERRLYQLWTRLTLFEKLPIDRWRHRNCKRRAGVPEGAQIILKGFSKRGLGYLRGPRVSNNWQIISDLHVSQMMPLSSLPWVHDPFPMHHTLARSP